MGSIRNKYSGEFKASKVKTSYIGFLARLVEEEVLQRQIVLSMQG